MSSHSGRKSGIVAFVVVLVVAILTLAGFSFVAIMQVERKATELRGRELQSQYLAESGETLIRDLLITPSSVRNENGGLYDNASFFQGRVVMQDASNNATGVFSIVSPRIEEGRVQGIRFGLTNESAKLNLAVLLAWEEAETGSGKKALLALPGMSETAADSILDWIDGDATARQSGSELSYYQGQGVPYGPRNAPSMSLEELLLVRDVSRLQVFGHDEDMNFLPDAASTSDASTLFSQPNSTSDGLPWRHLLTIYSAERNVSPEGEPRINLNENDLSLLHAELSEKFDPEWADFIVLYRQYGPAKTPNGPRPDRGSGNNNRNGSNGGSSRRAGSQGERRNDETPPIDLSVRGRIRLRNPLDLLDTIVQVPVASSSPEESDPYGGGPASPSSSRPPRRSLTLACPIAKDRTSREEDLLLLLDQCTTVNTPAIIGRVNVNEATRPVLEGIPGMPSAAVEQILVRRPLAGGAPDEGRRHPTWLWSEGIVDLPTMRRLMPYLTCGGEVYRGQIIGYFAGMETAFTRIEVVIDASIDPARRVYYKDLTLLGAGFPLTMLASGGTSGMNALNPMLPSSPAGSPLDDPFGNSFGGDDPFSFEETSPELTEPFDSSMPDYGMDFTNGAIE
jgi:hypothetical protein